ncbi:MAG: zinc ABC transporter substrate-binding protein [Pseudomonadales bacterium]|nr:zinc ABC transporter substrate-binding protein [Pseudomonadales bacterium]
MTKIKSIHFLFLLIIIFLTFLFIFRTFSGQQTKFGGSQSILENIKSNLENTQSNSRNTQAKLQNTQSKHQLLVSILPQKQIVEKIAGSNFVVNELIPPGFSPETYDPTVQEMKIVSKAEIYFRIGQIPFEKTHLSKLQEINSSMIIVDTSINNVFRDIEEHAHEGEEEHNYDETAKEEESNLDEPAEEIDPHIWLSPKMVKKQAEIIYNSLIEVYPEFENDFKINYQQLVGELDLLDQELENAFAPIKGKTMLVYHPAFGYLARDYGFNQEYIQIEGKEPSISDIQRIIIEAKNDDVHVIFVQKQFNIDSAKAIADNIDGVVVEIDPLDPDYFGNMRTIAQTISDKLR